MWILYSQIIVLGLIFMLSAITCLRSKRSVRCWEASISMPCGANRWAQTLLREMLSEAEYLQVRSYGFLEVPSPSIGHRVYRIPSAGGLVTAYEHGNLLMGLCLQPAQPLPPADVIVMHKLLIEANEQAYLQQANRFAPQVIGPPQDVSTLASWRQTSQPQEENH